MAPEPLTLTLPIPLALLVDAAAHEFTVQLTGATLSPLEELGCAVLRNWEHYEAAQFLAAHEAGTPSSPRP